MRLCSPKEAITGSWFDSSCHYLLAWCSIPWTSPPFCWPLDLSVISSSFSNMLRILTVTFKQTLRCPVKIHQYVSHIFTNTNTEMCWKCWQIKVFWHLALLLWVEDETRTTGQKDEKGSQWKDVLSWRRPREVWKTNSLVSLFCLDWAFCPLQIKLDSDS